MSNNYQQQDNASSDRMAEIRPDTHRSNPSERPITSLTRAASNTISSSSTTTAYYKNNFPQKLYRMLEYADTSPYDVQPIISWQPHGRSFMVKDKKRLQTEVLPLFFTTVHYDSFRRNLNHWGFHLINGVKNPDCGSYYHHLFLRTRLDLVNKIKRVKDKSCTPPVLNNTPSNASSSSSTRMPFYEPNFYEMEWLPQTQPQIPQQGYVSTISNSRQSTNTSAATFAPFTTTDSAKPSSIWWDPRSSSNHLSSDSSRSFMAPPSMRSTSCTSSLYPSSDDMKMESEKASSTEAASSDNSSSDNQDMKTESEKASSTEAASSDNSSSDNRAPPSRMSTSCTSSSPSSNDMIIDESQENKTKKVASMLLHDNVGDDVWDEEHWENFLTAQYHLLPSDLSELASVFDD